MGPQNYRKLGNHFPLLSRLSLSPIGTWFTHGFSVSVMHPAVSHSVLVILVIIPTLPKRSDPRGCSQSTFDPLTSWAGDPVFLVVFSHRFQPKSKVDNPALFPRFHSAGSFGSSRIAQPALVATRTICSFPYSTPPPQDSRHFQRGRDPHWYVFPSFFAPGPQFWTRVAPPLLWSAESLGTPSRHPIFCLSFIARYRGY